SGNMLGFDFAFTVGQAVAARVTREWAGLSRGFLGHSRYVLSIDPTVPPRLRLILIGGCIVLDLIRRKQKNQGCMGRGRPATESSQCPGRRADAVNTTAGHLLATVYA